MHPDSTRRAYPVSLQQAAAEAPTLAALAALARESANRLKAVETLIPAGLRQALQPGPVEGASWCVLVTGNAAAAKLRQLLPALQTRLRQQGWQVDVIRIKVLTSAR